MKERTAIRIETLLLLFLITTIYKPQFANATLKPYEKGESSLYLSSWDIHKNNTIQSMIDDVHVPQRQSIQSICTELVPNIQFNISTAIEHVVYATSSTDGGDSTIVTIQDVQQQCSSASTTPIICVIPTGITVKINSMDDIPDIVTRTVDEANTIKIVLSVYALVIRGGKFIWHSTASTTDDATTTQQQQQQQQDEQSAFNQYHSVVCAGYIVVEGSGLFSVTNGYDPDGILDDTGSNFVLPTVSSTTMYHKLWIYIRDNGAKHPFLGSRVLGGLGSSMNGNTTVGEQPTSSSDLNQSPQIIIRDRTKSTMIRSWSLLAKSVLYNDTTIQCLHDPIHMGWQIGDRIAIAPSIPVRSEGRAQTFIISDFIYDTENGTGGQIVLNKPSMYEFRGRSLLSPGSNEVIFDSSEVINLSRNTIITGDDFTEVPCDPTLTEVYPGFGTSTEGCMCAESRPTCTVGLHTVHMYSGYTQIDNVRIEYCGQRGIEGKYCTHFHHINDCPDCSYTNNAIEYSQQRGIVVHSTHKSTVEMNVLYNVRGSSIYLEDGNEIQNRLAYNVGICPYPFLEGGCTVPGTSNDQSDTALNQAGIYMENPTNDVIGNRMANHFNGMLLNPTNGHGPMEGVICTNHMPFGHWEGNTFHSSGRFGTYGLNDNYPLQSDTNEIESFFLPSTQGYNDPVTSGNTDSCSILTIDGYDNGLPTTFWHNVDYGNAFVGHYSAGDIQYYGHASMNNLNNLYWKETKSFEDGCTAHVSHSYLVNGTMALPDTIGAFIIEYTTLQQILLSMNHHCGIGVTGFLCMPHYILDHVTWVDDNIDSIEQRKWVSFTDSNDAGLGGIISISPNTKDFSESFLPQNYVSLVSGVQSYLLNTNYCKLANDLGYGVRYDYGILCTKFLQTLRIYSNGTEEFPLLLQIYNQSPNDRTATSTPIASQEIPFYVRTGKKRGYKFPVLPDDGLFYKLTLVGGSGNIPTSWFIDFGDSTITNRYGVTTLQIEIQGRACPNGLISSNHDRSYLSVAPDSVAGNMLWGHGACSDHPDTAINDCAVNSTSTDEVLQTTRVRGCPEKCGSTDCESLGAYCHCLLAQCQCQPGRYGANCEYDVCSNCNTVAGCASKFLGSSLPVSYQPCFCDSNQTIDGCEIETQPGDGSTTLSRPTPFMRAFPSSPSTTPDTPAGPDSIEFGSSSSHQAVMSSSRWCWMVLFCIGLYMSNL